MTVIQLDPSVPTLPDGTELHSWQLYDREGPFVDPQARKGRTHLVHTGPLAEAGDPLTSARLLLAHMFATNGMRPESHGHNYCVQVVYLDPHKEPVEIPGTDAGVRTLLTLLVAGQSADPWSRHLGIERQRAALDGYETQIRAQLAGLAEARAQLAQRAAHDPGQ